MEVAPYRAKAKVKTEINKIGFIDADGKIIKSLPKFAEDKKALMHLYEAMVLTRTLDKRMVKLNRMGKLSTYPEATGQEAFAVGVSYAMNADDIYVYYYRDQGAQLMRDIKASEIMAYWGGDERGNNYQNNRFDLPNCVPIATQYTQAAGVAFANKYKDKHNAVVVTGGDGSTSKGDFYEAMNVAGAWQLPLVFAINNNQWAISVPLSEQTNTPTLAEKAVAANIPCLQVDGNDVIAVIYAMQLALEHAHSGRGATLIEAVTYRLCNHTTADDASRYQPEADVIAAKRLEPIARLEKYCREQNILNDKKIADIKARCDEKIQQAVDEYSTTEKQKPTDMFDWLYETLPDIYLEQRQQLQGEKNA